MPYRWHVRIRWRAVAGIAAGCLIVAFAWLVLMWTVYWLLNQLRGVA